ncbi:MAG: monofunctional biosynthetic peptidoglycan transglycosylase [Bacteroidota bacterium]|nr:monofunctional biosynthetic peptidoglycan transglycosylase [Bacteroidota bacterium]
MFLFWTMLIFFFASFLQVLVLRWVPPIFTSFMAIRKAEMVIMGGNDKINYNWKPYEEISEYFALAVVAAEDQKFSEHYGFDLKAIETAIEKNKTQTKIKGASTISQQVAKNLFCWPGKSYLRKAIESYYTLLLELLLNKNRILEVYINIAELGPGIYGAEAAAKIYFKKSANKISRNEAALLAAVLPSPKRYSVRNPSAYVQRRAEWIKRQMNQLGGKKYLEKIQ